MIDRPDPQAAQVQNAGPRLPAREFMSPEHQRAVLEGHLMELAQAAAALLATAREMPYQAGWHAVDGHKLQALMERIQAIGPELDALHSSRLGKAELFGLPVVIDEGAPEGAIGIRSGDSIAWFRTLEVPTD
jgi:hypothetical protein